MKKPDTQELRLALSNTELTSWRDRAASHGLSVHDFIRRAVDDFDSEHDNELRALREHVSRIETKATDLAALLISLTR